MKRSTLFIGALVLIVTILVASVLGFTLRRGMQSDSRDLLLRIERLETENVQQVGEHRDANQHDHDCIVALALILGDPSRNRELPPSRPTSCERAPAAEGAK